MNPEEHEFLVWFYNHVDAGVRDAVKRQYEQTGNLLPESFRGSDLKRISAGTRGMRIDFTKEDTRQLHQDLCEVYNTEERLIALLQGLGISPGDIPFKGTIRDTWQAVLIDIHNRMKVNDLLTAVQAPQP